MSTVLNEPFKPVGKRFLMQSTRIGTEFGNVKVLKTGRLLCFRDIRRCLRYPSDSQYELDSSHLLANQVLLNPNRHQNPAQELAGYG